MIAGPTLVEAYAVLTRLPPPHRVAPEAAVRLLELNFLGPDVELTALEPKLYSSLVLSAPGGQISGGRIYDAVILQCATVAGVDVLLTFNERHFQLSSAGGPQIVVPGDGFNGGAG